jgi:general secretion pathway protein H
MTPMSATGLPNKIRGFTLLEILVTLVIVAAMAGLLVFSFHDNSQQRLQREAGDLAALLNLAADEAVLRGVEIGLVINEEGYRFVVFDAKKKEWQALPDKPLGTHAFRDTYQIVFALDGENVDKQALERIRKLSERSAEENLRPMLLLLSSGEVTPFTLTLSHAAASATLSSDGVNPIAVQPLSVQKS